MSRTPTALMHRLSLRQNNQLQPLTAFLHPTTSTSPTSTTTLLCRTPSYRPSPRRCHKCPLFSTCRLPHLSTTANSVGARSSSSWENAGRRGVTTMAREVPEVSVVEEGTLGVANDVKGKGKEKDNGRKIAFKPRKSVISLTNTAIRHLSALLDGPDPKLIRIGVKNKGCAGMSYHLDYVTSPGKFDEVVKTQDGEGREVEVVIDSKALFSIIGSQMDWEEGRMGSKFVFSNPNIKEQCGCGESFMV